MSGGLYYSHPLFLEHDPRWASPGHPESPERLRVLEAELAQRNWAGFERRPAPAADRAWLELAHGGGHIESIERLAGAGGGAIDADTFVGPSSLEAALHAAGGACEMTRALIAGEARSGFCAGRPPGHHAEGDRAMGFCLFNSIAVAAAMALAELGLERVLVLDWDIHHGNGTAEIFRRRADVLYVSIHESPLYPGTGPLEDIGSGAGEGYTINLPVAPASQEPQWLELLDRIVLPAARSYAPQLILVSAGFDAHRADPLAGALLEASSFALMAQRTRALAEELSVPLGLVLEGGYEPLALAASVGAVLDVLAADAPLPAASARAPETSPLTAAALRVLGPHWPLLGKSPI